MPRTGTVRVPFQTLPNIVTLSDIEGTIATIQHVNERKPFDRLRTSDAREAIRPFNHIFTIELHRPAMSKRSASTKRSGDGAAMAEREGLVMLRMISTRPACGCPFRFAPQTLCSGSTLLPLPLLGFAQWRRGRDWFCCAKSLRDHLRCPISASLRRTRPPDWFSSLIPATPDSLLGFAQWRRGRDSNPRYRFQYTSFPGMHNRPLCHLSLIGKRSEKPSL